MGDLILTWSLLSLLSFGCNAPDKEPLSDEEMLALERQGNDSLMIVLDSIMRTTVEVPQLVDSSFFSIECFNAFNRLAKETNGSLTVVADSRHVARTIIGIIGNNASDNSDLMILIDKTSSMRDDLDNIRKGLDQILNALLPYRNIRLAVGTYGDKNVDGRLWYDFQSFEGDFKGTRSFINSIRMTHGGDFPESVYDGIHQAFQEGFWRSDSKRMVILLGDAPSLDPPLSTHTIEDVVAIAKGDRINMNFYPIVLSPHGDSQHLIDGPHMEKAAFIDNVYPNPTNGPLSVLLGKGNDLTLELIDQKGAVLISRNVTSDHERMDLYDMPNGLYVVRVYDRSKNFDDRKVLLHKQ